MVGRAHMQASEPEELSLVAPMYYTSQAVRKPASQAYRQYHMMRLAMFFLWAVGLTVIVSVAASHDHGNSVPRQYGDRLWKTFWGTAPIFLSLLTVEPMQLLFPFYLAPLYKLARRSDDWFDGIAWYVARFAAVLVLQFTTLWSFSVFYSLMPLCICCMVLAIWHMKDLIKHDAPTRGLYAYGPFWRMMRRLLPGRWDVVSMSGPGDQGAYFTVGEEMELDAVRCSLPTDDPVVSGHLVVGDDIARDVGITYDDEEEEEEEAKVKDEEEEGEEETDIPDDQKDSPVIPPRTDSYNMMF